MVGPESSAQRMSAYLDERAARPFGNLEISSGRALSSFSKSSFTAASNLLAKADDALIRGDRERADRFMERAAALNYDDHEQTAPAAFASHMMLFDAVTDALEGSVEGDRRWLDAAVATLLSAGVWGQSEMRYVLLAVRQDYATELSESRTIRDVVADVPERAELRDVVMSPAELVEAVTSVLQSLQIYRAALNSTSG